VGHSVTDTLGLLHEQTLFFHFLLLVVGFNWLERESPVSLQLEKLLEQQRHVLVVLGGRLDVLALPHALKSLPSLCADFSFSRLLVHLVAHQHHRILAQVFLYLIHQFEDRF